jgi:hypothetical protein
MLVVLLASIDSKKKLKRCWVELCHLVSVAGQGWATEKSVRPLFLHQTWLLHWLGRQETTNT